MASALANSDLCNQLLDVDGMQKELRTVNGC